PVLSVVFITMVINVLKVFDIVLSVAPGSVQDDGNVIALAMWRTAFGGINDFGLGPALAVFLFVLVIPVLLLSSRAFRGEAPPWPLWAPKCAPPRHRPRPNARAWRPGCSGWRRRRRCTSCSPRSGSSG